MSQTAISTKYTITATTGTAGTTWDVAGRNDKGVLQWRQAGTVNIPNSDTIITHSGKFSKNGTAWSSLTTMKIPVMETITNDILTGYQAQPKVAEYCYFNLDVQRTSLLSQSDALRKLDEFAYALLIDAKLRASVLGYVIADA